MSIAQAQGAENTKNIPGAGNTKNANEQHRLKIQNFRCVKDLAHIFEPGINLFFGVNGSGKTTVVEAIDFLSRRRTFRTGYIQPLVQTGAEKMRLQWGENPLALTIEKQKQSKLVAKIGNKPAQRTIQARRLPLRIVHSGSANALINGPTEASRHALDWGLFYREPAFYEVWGKYNRALKQRNTLLRQGAPQQQCAQWDDILGELSGPLESMREAYAKRLIEKISELVEAIWASAENRPGIEFVRGWECDTTLREVLHKSYDSDKIKGYTQYGAHRMRLRWMWSQHREDAGARPAGKFSPSGGQLKMLACAHMIAQVLLHEEDRTRQEAAGADAAQSTARCILAIDDFTSELDKANQARLLEWLQALENIIVVTTLDHRLFDKLCATATSLPQKRD